MMDNIMRNESIMIKSNIQKVSEEEEVVGRINITKLSNTTTMTMKIKTKVLSHNTKRKSKEVINPKTTQVTKIQLSKNLIVDLQQWTTDLNKITEFETIM